jgi:hypothetical protein
VFIRYWARESAAKALDLFGKEYHVRVPVEKGSTRSFNENKFKTTQHHTHEGHGGDNHTGQLQPPTANKTCDDGEKNLDLVSGYCGKCYQGGRVSEVGCLKGKHLINEVKSLSEVEWVQSHTCTLN